MQIDWVKYRDLADRVLQYPATLEEVKNLELAYLLTYADRVKVEIFTTIPAELQHRIKPTEQRDFKNAERLEVLVKAEQAKRLEPTPQAKQERKSKPDILPDHLSLEDAVKDANILRRIWEQCAKQARPAFDIAGNFIWQRKGTDAVLYAFAAAMKSRNLLKPDITPQTFYAILCKRHGIPQASRPDKLQKGKNIYPDMLSDFLGILNEFTH